jgi:hypothetical protein
VRNQPVCFSVFEYGKQWLEDGVYPTGGQWPAPGLNPSQISLKLPDRTAGDLAQRLISKVRQKVTLEDALVFRQRAWLTACPLGKEVLSGIQEGPVFWLLESKPNLPTLPGSGLSSAANIPTGWQITV